MVLDYFPRRWQIRACWVLLLAGALLACSHSSSSANAPVAGREQPEHPPAIAAQPTSAPDETTNQERGPSEPASPEVAQLTAAPAEDPETSDVAEAPSTPAPASDPQPLTAKTIESIKKRMIQASIDAYDGSCPCPYNSAKNGSRCGRRSAYSREGGESPLCFPSDITEEMVREFMAAEQ